MSDDLTDVAGGDTHRARALRDHLTQLAKGSNPLLREMATAVLNGDLQLRDAANSDAYSNAIGDTFDTFWTAYQDMTPDERSDLLALGHQHIERAE